MQTENWHEERDRLVELLHCAEVLGVGRRWQGYSEPAITPEDLAILKKRLVQLNERLGDGRARISPIRHAPRPDNR